MDAPVKNYRILRKLIPSFLQPSLRGIRKRMDRKRSELKEPYYSVFPFTQAHPIRQENLLRLATIIETEQIPGAIVECGVLDGGTAALMGYATKDRSIHLFDSWEGLPSTTIEDGESSSVWSGDVVGSINRVKSVMKKLNVDPARLNFHKGWFENTFPATSIKQIALLHVDGDFYESVRLTLNTWAPKIAAGGFIQIDDYSAFIGCRRAVDEFLSKRPHLKLETFNDLAFFIRAA